MATIVESEHEGKVVWLGRVPAKSGNIRSEALADRLELAFEGVAGERHEGSLRPACVRTTMMYPEGTEIRNVRQVTILSQEELDTIAEGMSAERVDPRHLGATVVISGIPDFTHIPPSSRLQGPSGVTLTVDMENLPCQFPAREIETDHPGLGSGFKPAAQGRRGVTAWVERPGPLGIGDAIRLFVPTQRAWEPES